MGSLPPNTPITRASSATPTLPAGKWSARKVFRIRFTNVQTTVQAFQIGDDAGTNGATMGTLTIDGTYGTSSATVFKSMGREAKYYITDIKVNADSGPTADAVGLTLQRKQLNGSSTSSVMENADISTQWDNQTNIRPWVGVNWLLRGVDMLFGNVAIGSVTTKYVELVIGYHERMPSNS